MQQSYQCPKCGTPVVFGSKFCGNCGSQLNWPGQQQMQPPPGYYQYPPQQQPPYGYQQQWPPYPYQQPPPKKQSSVWPIVLILLIGIAFIVAGAIYLVTPR